MPVPPSIAALASRRDELRDLVIAWANQNSGSNNPTGLAAMAGMLHAAFDNLGSTELVPTADNGTVALRLRFRPDAPMQVLFSGHYDTVFHSNHPFQRCEPPSSGRLVGPGVIDMKGGLAVLLAALQAFNATAAADRLGGEILLTPDEETGSVGSRHLIEEAAGRHDLALVFEPARETGEAVRGRMGVGVFTVTCRGRAAHAGNAGTEGRNAIVALAEMLPKIHALTTEMGGAVVNVATIRGGGVINIVPDLAQAEVNIRVSRSSDMGRMAACLREIAEPIHARDGFSVEVSGGFNRPPKEVGPPEEALFSAWQTCAEHFGVRLGWKDVAGGSDGNLIAAAGVATLDGLGPIGGNLHSDKEWLDLDSIVPRAQTAALFLHRLATGEIPVPPRRSSHA